LSLEKYKSGYLLGLL